MLLKFLNSVVSFFDLVPVILPNVIIANESFEFPNDLPPESSNLFRQLTAEQKEKFVWFSAGNYGGDAGCRIVNRTNYFPPFIDGNQCIDIQLTSYIQQTLFLDVGTYLFSTYYVSYRGEERNPIEISIDDKVLTTITKLVSSWTLFTHTFTITEAGNKLLRLQGLNDQPEFQNSRTGVDLIALTKESDVMNSNFENLLANISNKTPIAYFRAEDFIQSTGKFPAHIGEFIGDTSRLLRDDGDGNGADAVIPYLVGAPDTRLNFNANVPNTFTICTITRYNGSNTNRVIVTQTDNWLHGHLGSKRGISYYKNRYLTSEIAIEGSRNDWLVMCGKNGSSPPNNVLANNIKRGVNSGGGGGQINIGVNISDSFNQPSAFAFSKLLIWDKILTDDEMQKVSNYLTQYLKDGLE
jgi:hypothetical protein